MSRRSSFLVVLFLSLSMPLGALAQTYLMDAYRPKPVLRKADDVTGTWWTQRHDSQVRIYPKEGRYYGRVVWVKEGEVGRKALGKELLLGFRFDGRRRWDDGRVIDPRDGKTYAAALTLEDVDHLAVEGYLGVAGIGKRMGFERVR